MAVQLEQPAHHRLVADRRHLHVHVHVRSFAHRRAGTSTRRRWAYTGVYGEAHGGSGPEHRGGRRHPTREAGGHRGVGPAPGGGRARRDADGVVPPRGQRRHVAGAVVERLLAGFPDVPSTGPWRERCHTWALDARAALMPYPGLARHVLLHWVELPGVLRSLDHLGAALAAGAGRDRRRGRVERSVHLRADAGAGGGGRPVRRPGARPRRTLGELAADVPFLWSHRHEYAVARLDEHFEYGLDALLSGIVTAHRRRRRARP